MDSSSNRAECEQSINIHKQIVEFYEVTINTGGRRSQRKIPLNSYRLLKEDVPITTKQQLGSNLWKWSYLLTLVANATHAFGKKKMTLMRMSEIVGLILSETAKIRGDEHYRIVYMIPGILKKLSDIGIFTREAESRKQFCSQLSTRIKKIATILDKADDGRNRWRRAITNMKKKLTKISNNCALYLCLHADEMARRLIIYSVAQVLLKTMSCLDKMTPTPQTPQPFSSKTTKGQQTKEATPPKYRPKNKKKSRKKMF